MSNPETVRVVSEVSDDNPLGYVVINKDDYVEGEHELFDKPTPKKGKAAAPADDKPAE